MNYVFANMCPHHVENPPEAIREMARVVQPGGRLVITDLEPHDFTFLREEHHDRWMGFARAARSPHPGNLHHPACMGARQAGRG